MANLGWGGVGINLGAGDGSEDDSTVGGTPERASTGRQQAPQQPETPSWAQPKPKTPSSSSSQKQKQKPTPGSKSKSNPSSSSTPASSTAASTSKDKAKKGGDDAPAIVPVVEGNEPEASQKEIHLRMDELNRREAAVKQREDYVKSLESQLRDGGIEVKPKNWPKCKPILYHDISAEIPAHNQPCCKAGYFCWMLAISSYAMNFLCVIVQLFMGTGNISCFFFAALASVIGVFCSWWTVYSSLYKALQTQGGTFAYGKYFIHKGIFIGWCIWVIIAPPIGTPACFVSGFFVMIDQFGKGGSKGTTGGVMSIINLVLWGLTLFLSAYEIIWAFTIWKKGGGPRELQRTQEHATTAAAIFQNDTVSSTATRLFGGAPKDDGYRF